MSRLVTDHLPLLAGAPNGVKKLRELILELAVRGKLVQQDPQDKQAQYSTKTAKHPHAETALDEKRFEIPVGWVWARFSDVAETRLGKMLDKAKNAGELKPYLRNTNVQWHGFDLADIKEIRLESHELSEFSVLPGDLLICEGGDPGRCSIWQDGSQEIYFQKALHRARARQEISPEYLRLCIRSDYNSGHIATLCTGATIKHFTGERLAKYVLPIPPFPEQQRIVAKVDELMALCDRLDTRQSDAQAAHARLVDELLGSLLQARDAEDFQSCWQLLAENFQTVFTTEASVDALQSVVFGLAARGLLTRQNEADEQSSQLLERIAQHKQVRDKSTSRQQTLQEGNLATAGDVPFPLPNSWCWARWNDVALKIGDIDHKMPTPDPAGVPFVSPRDFYPGNVIDFEGAKRVARSDFERLSAKIRAECDDLIYPRYGTIGENVLVTVDRDFLVSYSCAVIKVAKGFVEPRYQFYVSLSDCIRKQAKAAENKTTQANVGIKSIQNFFFPLPPHTEQVRIVAKVNELLALCDRLKARIRQARQVQERLAGTLVERAVL